MNTRTLVVGAGLAGAALAHALTRRGRQVILVDAAPGPAQRASALPVGMLSPHLTRSPTPMSRLSEVGASDMHAALRGLLPEGSGWQTCTIHNQGHAPGHWPAAMVRPSDVVNAWLALAAETGHLSVRWSAPVEQLILGAPSVPSSTNTWKALDASGDLLAEAEEVVLAGAWGTLGLLERSGLVAGESDLPLRPVKGQMSFGALTGDALGAEPLRDNGVFVPCFQTTSEHPDWPSRMWAMGSTYDRNTDSREVTDAAHQKNLQSLEALSSDGADLMRAAMADGSLRGWADVRCASLDRLPLVGALPDFQAWAVQEKPRRGLSRQLDKRWVPLQPRAFLLCALGSRGLTLSHWAANYLAAQMDGEQPELDADLQRAIDPARFTWRLWRQQEPAAGAIASPAELPH